MNKDYDATTAPISYKVDGLFPPPLQFASVASASDACWDTWSEQVCEEGQEEAGVVVGVRAGVVSGVGRHPAVLPH